jgi:hypothetical protein
MKKRQRHFYLPIHSYGLRAYNFEIIQLFENGPWFPEQTNWKQSLSKLSRFWLTFS